MANTENNVATIRRKKLLEKAYELGLKDDISFLEDYIICKEKKENVKTEFIDKDFYIQRGSYAYKDKNDWGIEVNLNNKVVNSDGEVIKFVYKK